MSDKRYRAALPTCLRSGFFCKGEIFSEYLKTCLAPVIHFCFVFSHFDEAVPRTSLENRQKIFKKAKSTKPRMNF